MGLFSCCFAPAPADAVVRDVPAPAEAPPAAKAEPGGLAAKAQVVPSDARPAPAPPAEPPALRDNLSKSWSKLNQSETNAVQQTLLKVSELIERFAEGSAEREAPVHALKKALQLVATDCHASYASMSVVSADQASFLVMGCVGSSHEALTLPNVVTPVGGSGSSVERLLRPLPGSSADSGSSGAGAALSWSADDGGPPPADWAGLAGAGIRHMHGMPIRGGPESLLGVLNLGFKRAPCLDVGAVGPHLFGTYLSLVSATLTAVVRDPGLNAYVLLARDLAAAGSVDAIMSAALSGSRAALTRLAGLGGAPGGGGSHTWLRLALISGDKSAAALFDDLGQAGVARASKRSASGHSGGSAQWVASIQAAGGLVRTNIPMKNTILRIALTNKKQVLIPDVQKLINQLGNVNTDLFASRLLRPPSSVLLLPLRASGVGIYGALYCLADSHTEFSEVAKQLKEVAELLGGGLNRALSGPLAAEYMAIQQLNHEALLSRDGAGESGGSHGGGAAGHSSGIYGVTPVSVTPATTAGSLPTGPYALSTTTASSSLTAAGPVATRGDSSFMAAAAAGGALEFGSTIGTHASWAGSLGGSMCSAGGSMSGAAGLGGARSFTTRQVASSTNAVATGITEKLNQKRIDASMAEPEDGALGALQLVAQIGEGGFAKVFRGLFRGLVVAVKVVGVGDPSNERAVMKNAHEIAILRSSSHPNIIQAYLCMTDVAIRDVIALCTRQAPRQQRGELVTALAACGLGSSRGGGGGGQHGGGPPADDATCHIEVVEYCDLGNLTSAIRSQIFSLPPPAAPRSRRSAASRASSGGAGGGSYDSADDGSCTTDGGSSVISCSTAHAVSPPLPGAPGGVAVPAASGGSVGGGRLRVNMRWLLLTLLEVAEGMAYLHRMGVVHCDLKPANVLLKSSNADVRGFSAKVSDFGLSRVEDDDTCATFPFNSCGTAAYVAPEALITTKKVNASVDVYAFGVMMWELFVGQRPYGNMSQQKVVEEVVLRGLRPSFPVGTPPGYAQLAASCWHATAGARPTFQEAIARLQAMLHQAEESEVAAAASCSLTGSEAWGGRADGLGAGQQLGGARGGGARSGLPPAAGPRVATSDAAAAAAAAIAQAAAAWKAHGAPPSGRASSAGGSDSGRCTPGGTQQQVQQQLQAAQVLQWQQQQAQLLQQQAARQHPQGSARRRSTSEDIAAHAAQAMAAAHAAQAQQAQAAAAAADQAAAYQQQLQAAAASGSVYEFQQVGFGGESVVGTGTVGSAHFGAGAGAGLAASAAQQAALLQAAAAAAGYGGGAARRAPARSKTFTAAGCASSAAAQYDMAVAQAQAAAAAAAAHAAGGGGGDAGGSGHARSPSFGSYGGEAGQLSLAQQQALLAAHQRHLLQYGGYSAAAGLLAGQQRAAAAAAAAAQQQFHQQQQHHFGLAPLNGGGGYGNASTYAGAAAQQRLQAAAQAAAAAYSSAAPPSSG
ncbi:STY13 [Scenedesmus sp. PABB004]|nr:STY13 [Scenedesmus sp. PABB004]